VKYVGVLGVQGDITEHVHILEEVARKLGLGAKVIIVNTPEGVEKLSALVMPGGESTTLGKLLRAYKIDESIKKIAAKGVPIMGTCAGLIMLAKNAFGQKKGGQHLLGLLDVSVDRNAYGRQRESFEADLNIPAVGKEPFHGVFIRAPVIEKVFGRAKALAEYDGRIVMVREGNLLGLAFHPEISGDTRIHEYFLKMMKV